jgi:site-specific DNA recombinase
MRNRSLTMIRSDKHIQAALYARVSSDQQAQAGTIASQVEAIGERIRADGLSVQPELCFLDEGYSGSILARPSLARLRELAAHGAIDRLYVHSPDRLARRYAYQVLLIEDLKQCGVELVFLNQPSADTPEENLLLEMQAAIAEYERTKILERSRRGKRHAARQGSIRVLAGAPYGYRYVGGQKGNGEARYQIVLEEARVVRQIFEWVGQERLSIGEVARRLQQQEIPTRSGKPYWHRATVWGILKNPAYKGLAGYGKTRVGPRRARLRPQRHMAEPPRSVGSVYDVPPEEWIGIPVPAILSEELFSAVARQLDENRRRHRQRRGGSRHLLQGLVVCQACGYALYGQQSRYETKRGARSQVYYRCSGRDARRYGGQRRCGSRSVHAAPLEEGVWEDVCSLLSDPQRIEQEYERRLAQRQQGVGWESTERLEAQVKKVKQGMARLIDLYQEGVVSREELEPRLRQAKERLGRLEADLAAEREAEIQEEDLRLVIGQMQAFAEQVASGLREADWGTRREIIRALVKRIEVGAEDVRIVYRIDPGQPPGSPGTRILRHCRWRA